MVTLLLVLSMIQPIQAADWSAWLRDPPRALLREEFHSTCRRPCELLGFSFTYTLDEMRAIKATGANALTLGAMWIPVQDDSAPYGCGFEMPGGAQVLGQTFRTEVEFDALAPCLPTAFSSNSGCAWTLFRSRDDDLRAEMVARGAWENVADNSWPEATFEPQPPGSYLLELSDPTGTWIGWWAAPQDPYPGGQALVSGHPRPDLDFELRLRVHGRWRDLTAAEGHQAVQLGPDESAILQALGFRANYSVGDWNNPGFPYLPDWFNERFPDALAVDQNGERFVSGMFDRLVPAPGVESPVLVEGASRFIRATVRRLLQSPTIAYWVMGGEALYATYCAPRRWFDYSDLARRHFRAWLAAFRYPTVADLNRAWGSDFESFAAVDPPRSPQISQCWLDWLDFRFASMGERFAWHYRAARAEDRGRLIMTCNHGTLYADGTYAALGARPELYAGNSDGFETGQIITDADPELYNVVYMESLGTLGKPYCPARLAYKKSDPRARGGGTSYTPQAARRYIYESLGGDAWHLGLIQWSGSLPDGEWGVAGTPAEQEIARVFGEINQLAPVLEDMHALMPRVGVFLSHPTWAFHGWQPSWQALHVAAVESQVPKVYVYDEQLKSGAADDLNTLVTLDNALVDCAVLQALERFMNRGGRLLIGGRFADESLGPVDPVSAAIRQRLLVGATVLRDTQPETILEALGASACPVKVACQQTVTRPLEVNLAPGAEDWPQDLREASSLGQTITVPAEGLTSIAIRTPTFWKVPPVGFRFEVKLGGPEGPVISSQDVPGKVADNSWQEVAIPRAPSPGTVLYLRAVPHPELPAAHLGWWSTRRDEIPDGTAYVDDRPVSGDRQVRMSFEQRVPGSRAVEVFTLTDGLNAGVVVINTAGVPLRAELDLGSLTGGRTQPAFRVRCPLQPDAWANQGLVGTLNLAPHGTAFLYVQAEVNHSEAARLAGEARRAVERWHELGAATTFARYAADKAQAQLAAGRDEKAAAMALKVLGQMGLRAEVSTGPDERLLVTAHCFASDGSPLSPQQAWCEFVPTPAFWRPMVPDGDARCVKLERQELPPQYDYAAGQYRPFVGPLRIHVRVRHGNLRAQEILDTQL